MPSLAAVFDNYIRPRGREDFATLLHRAESGQRLVCAVVLAVIGGLAPNRRGAFGRTVLSRMLRTSTGVFALTTRDGLALLTQSEHRFVDTWQALRRAGVVGAPRTDERHVDGWSTELETSLRHFSRLPPAAMIADARDALEQALSRLCDRLVSAPELPAVEGEDLETTLVSGPDRMPLAPFAMLEGDALMLWDGVRSSDASDTSGVARWFRLKPGGASREHRAEPLEDWRAIGAAARLVAGLDGQEPLALFTRSEAPSEVSADRELWLSRHVDPLAWADEVALHRRGPSVPVLVVRAENGDDPFVLLAAMLGVSARSESASTAVVAELADWDGGAPSDDPRSRPVVVIAGDSLRAEAIGALERALSGAAKLLVFTRERTARQQWPAELRGRFRVGKAEASHASARRLPSHVQTLLDAGLKPRDAWAHAAIEIFELPKSSARARALDALADVMSGRTDVLQHGLALRWWDAGHVEIRPDGSLVPAHAGWRELVAGLLGAPCSDEDLRDAWHAGRALRERAGGLP